VKQRAGQHLLQLETAIFLEFPTTKYITRLDRESLRLPTSWLDGRKYKFYRNAGAALQQLVPSKCISEMVFDKSAPCAVVDRLRDVRVEVSHTDGTAELHEITPHSVHQSGGQ